PDGVLVQGSDGAFYGTTYTGGPYNGGVVFRIGSAVPVSVTAIDPTSGPSSGGTSVTISGTGFQFGAVAAIGGKAVDAVATAAEIFTAPPPLAPGTLNDVKVTNPDNSTATLPSAFLADFLDVAYLDIFHAYVEKIFRAGITAGYGNGYFGRDD